MTLFDSRNSEYSVILESAIAVLDGPFLDDWEFPIRIGATRTELADVIESWKSASQMPQSRDQLDIINNCINELCNGIRASRDLWDSWISVSREDLCRIYEEWHSRYYL